MRVKYGNPKIKQFDNASQLGYSSSTLQRNKNDITLLPWYRIQPNNTKKCLKKASNTNIDNSSHREFDVKRPQMTSNDLKTTQKKENQKRKTKMF